MANKSSRSPRCTLPEKKSAKILAPKMEKFPNQFFVVFLSLISDVGENFGILLLITLALRSASVEYT